MMYVAEYYWKPKKTTYLSIGEITAGNYAEAIEGAKNFNPFQGDPFSRVDSIRIFKRGKTNPVLVSHPKSKKQDSGWKIEKQGECTLIMPSEPLDEYVGRIKSKGGHLVARVNIE
ncbi:hypothetical protein HYX00_06875 [Candidatus Woesearchaeota archaeon]|nr:hypothetical protein [Candidatus Woesearchaeota archaeon]